MSSATFLGKDTTSQGSWVGRYGSLGYGINALATAWPAVTGAPVITGAPSNFTWADPSVRPQAPQKPGGATRIESAWFLNTPFTFTFTNPGTLICRTYHCDFDPFSRDQKVDILDSNGVTVLNTQTTGFTAGLAAEINNGVWYSWRITGNFGVRMTYLGPSGPNAVISAIMFDSAIINAGGGLAIGSSGLSIGL